MNKDVVYIVCVIILLFLIFSISSEHWSKKHVKGGKIYMGLWKQCGKGLIGGKDMSCVHLPPEGVVDFPKNSLYACRALSMLSVLLLLSALACMMYKDYASRMCISSLLILSGICAVVTCIVWYTEMLKLKMPDGSTMKMEPCYSYNLCMIAGLMAIGLASYVQFS